MKKAIQSKDAPAAIGTYSQAVRAGDSVYLSGQIGLDPASMQLAEGIEAQTHRVFRNLAAVADAAGLGLGTPLAWRFIIPTLRTSPALTMSWPNMCPDPFPVGRLSAWRAFRRSRPFILC